MPLLKLTSHERKIIFLSSLGGALEFYDFIIYVIFAQTLGQVFFPTEDKLATLMSVYAIFSIGYLVRPLGGLMFSHFGDKNGRKKTFITSVMMIAVPTFMIDLLPTYQHAVMTIKGNKILDSTVKRRDNKVQEKNLSIFKYKIIYLRNAI